MPKRILLADDSITIQKVVELTFSDGDYEIITANNGARALQKLSENTPDIILSDIIMPERNGYEVCEFVKSHPQYRNIPVILLTGTFEPFDPDRAEKAGCDAVVTKPFESQALINKVEELIDARRRADEERRSRPAEQAPPPPPPAPEPPAAAWNIPTFTPFPSTAAESPGAPLPEDSPFSAEPWSDASATPASEPESPFGTAPEFQPIPPDLPPSEEPAVSASPSPYDAETRAFPLVPPPPEPAYEPAFEPLGEPVSEPVQEARPEAEAEIEPEPVIRDIEESPWSQPEGVPAPEPMARTLQFPTVTGEWETPPEEPSGPISPEPFISSWTPQEEPARPEPLPTQAIPVPAEVAEEEPGSPMAEEESVFEPMEEPAFVSAPDEEEVEPPYVVGESFEEAASEAPAEEQPFAPAEEPQAENELYAEPRALEFPVTEQAPLLSAPQPASQPGNGLSLTEAEVDRIARRVVELMTDQLVRNIAWEVIPDVAEAVVRERVRELEENH